MRVIRGSFWLLACLSASGGAAAAQESEWREVHSNADGAFELAAGSVRREGATVTVRSRVRFTAVQEDGTASFVTTFRYHCANRTAELLSVVSLGPNGATLNAEEVPAAERVAEPIPAGSPNEAIIAIVCA